MYTFLIIGGVSIVVLFILFLCGVLDSEAVTISSIICFTMTVLSIGSVKISQTNIPEGYQKIESYSYVTETGSTETIDGPYYKKNGIYYEQKLGKANWIPFYPCDFVEVTLPGNTTTSEPSVENEAKKFCTSCGNKLNVEDKFCAGCGTEVKE